MHFTGFIYEGDHPPHATLVRSIQCYWFVISYADLKFILIECSPFSRLNSTRNTRN